MSAKTPVAVIGLGPMGARMAETFVEGGRPTTVWNRTASKADPLVAKGAVLAPTPADALAAADVVVISQTDYQAMYDSLGGVTGALKGRTLVNLSSGSPAELRKAAEWAAEHGAELLTGGIMTPPPGIGRPGAYVFYSGSEAALDRHRDTLKEIADTTYVGSDAGLSMLFYQAQLYMFWSATISFVYASAMVGSAGVGARELLPFARRTVVDLGGDGPMGFLRIISDSIDAGVYPGEANSLHMQAVGADHVVETGREAGLDTSGPEAIRDLFWRAVRAGHGTEGLTSVIQVIRDPA